MYQFSRAAITKYQSGWRKQWNVVWETGSLSLVSSETFLFGLQMSHLSSQGVVQVVLALS
jgi:hypothetical protein